jgi:hypothetical protein
MLTSRIDIEERKSDSNKGYYKGTEQSNIIGIHLFSLLFRNYNKSCNKQGYCDKYTKEGFFKAYGFRKNSSTVTFATNNHYNCYHILCNVKKHFTCFKPAFCISHTLILLTKKESVKEEVLCSMRHSLRSNQ